jgi:hypothetical protein
MGAQIVVPPICGIEAFTSDHIMIVYQKKENNISAKHK